MWLLARLARLNIGHIDWEPHMSLMFTRFLRSLNLPVLYKKMHPGRIHKLDLSAVSQWIVSTMVGLTVCGEQTILTIVGIPREETAAP